MHSVTFQIKRAHLRAVAFGKGVIERRVKNMTPARFDLMYAIRTYRVQGARPIGTTLEQNTLCKRLGLHSSTVSKLIKRLVQLGWLENLGRGGDRRTNVIALTEKGIRSIVKAMRIVFRMRTHLLHFENLFRKLDCSQHVLEAIDEFWCKTDAIARSFGDTSELQYDFGYPDE
jgi:DNA-binding MarR family transcriptional regulator